MKRSVTLDDGKYTVEHVDAPDYSFKALRHGEEWRDLCGDGLVLAMFERICELEQVGSVMAQDYANAIDAMDHEDEADESRILLETWRQAVKS